MAPRPPTPPEQPHGAPVRAGAPVEAYQLPFTLPEAPAHVDRAMMSWLDRVAILLVLLLSAGVILLYEQVQSLQRSEAGHTRDILSVTCRVGVIDEGLIRSAAPVTDLPPGCYGSQVRKLYSITPPSASGP